MTGRRNMKVLLAFLMFSGVASAADVVLPGADRSLTTAEYVKAGFPAPDRTWTGTEALEAAKLLAVIAEKQPSSLPRADSPRSGKMFARMVAPQPYDGPPSSLPGRTGMAFLHVSALNEMYKVYLAALERKATGEVEVVELLGASLRAMVRMVSLSDLDLTTLERAPDYRERAASLAQAKAGLATMAVGAVQALGTSGGTVLGSEARGRLVACLVEVVPRLPWHIPPAALQEIVARIGRLRAEPEIAGVAPELDRLLDATADETIKAVAVGAATAMEKRWPSGNTYAGATPEELSQYGFTPMDGIDVKVLSADAERFRLRVSARGGRALRFDSDSPALVFEK